MGKISDSFLDSRIYRRALNRWTIAAREAQKTPLDVLRRQATRARELRAHLNKLIGVADERLALPAVGSTQFPRPHNADWAWRPEIWRGSLAMRGITPAQSPSRLGDEVALFHDCPKSEITLRQLRNQHVEDLAPFGLCLDVFSFDGSFLSLVLDLPEGAVAGLTRSHILRTDCLVETEQPIEIFVRLNVQNGPNTEQIVREFPAGAKRIRADFDLAYARMNENRIDKAWVDLIFETPRMNQVVLRDLTFCRHPRAQI